MDPTAKAMKRSICFTIKEHCSDQRRTASIVGSIDGVRVQVIDLSFGGTGGRFVLRANTARVNIREGQDAVLTLTGANGRQAVLSVRIAHMSYASGGFGATFTGLTSKNIDMVEKLMFPRRETVAA